MDRVTPSRNELKYLINPIQAAEIRGALARYTKPDTRGDDHGQYRVRSLYFDTADYQAYWDKVNGHNFRRKLRIRSYGENAVTPNSLCFVEIKQRFNKTVQKRRIVLPYIAAATLCSPGQTVDTGNLAETERGVADEVRYMVTTLNLMPVCLVSYVRQAFVGDACDAGLRVTFDTDITCRANDLSLPIGESGADHKLLPPESCIMEIKLNGKIPYWLSELLAKNRCTLRRISKYCAAVDATHRPGFRWPFLSDSGGLCARRSNPSSERQSVVHT